MNFSCNNRSFSTPLNLPLPRGDLKVSPLGKGGRKGGRNVDYFCSFIYPRIPRINTEFVDIIRVNPCNPWTKSKQCERIIHLFFHFDPNFNDDYEMTPEDGPDPSAARPANAFRRSDRPAASATGKARWRRSHPTIRSQGSGRHSAADSP